MNTLIRMAMAMIAVVGLATPSMAQVFTGRVDLKIVDASGAVVPGVTVELSGQERHTAVTDESGEAHFLNLAPGTYMVTAKLQGFRDYTNNDVAVTAGSSVPLRVTMAVATVEEAVTVVAETPAIDPKKTATATTVTNVELQSIPSSRDPWVVLQTVPGVIVDRVNVGGAESGQQSDFQAKGSAVEQNTWTLDGITITDMAATGSSAAYYDFDMFQQMQITTGGADLQQATGGVGVNLVLKSGSNTLRGSGRVFFENESMQATNLPSDLAATLGGATGKGNRIDEYLDTGGELGGPILRDRLWAWGAYGKTDVTTLTIDGEPDQTIPLTHEFQLGLDREIMTNFAVSGTFTYRRFTNFTWRNNGVTDEDYEQAFLLEGSHPVIGNYSVPVYEPILSAVPENTEATIFRNRDGYWQRYLGFEFAATKRLSNRWMARFGFSANGLYQAPWGVNLAANVVSRLGFAMQYNRNQVVTNDPLLQLKTVFLLEEPGQEWLPAVTSLDLRVGKEFRVERVSFNVDLDVFNALNTATVHRPRMAAVPRSAPTAWVDCRERRHNRSLNSSCVEYDRRVKQDVAVIGGGVIGVASAVELARRGAQVTVLERDRIGHGCSYGNAGWLTPSQAVPLANPAMLLKSIKWMLDPESPLYIQPRLDPAFIRWLIEFLLASRTAKFERGAAALVELCRVSVDLWEEIAKRSPETFGFERHGLLSVYENAASLEAARPGIDLVCQSGVRAERWTADEVRAKEPAVVGPQVGAYFYPDDAHCEPFGAVKALEAEARALGVRFLEHAEVFRISNGGGSRRLTTTRGEVIAQQIVVATGPWSEFLGGMLGFRLPVIGAKGYSIVLPPAKPHPTRSIYLIERKIAVNPHRDALRIAGTLELVRHDFSINARRVDVIVRGAKGMLNIGDSPEPREIWRGLRPCTPDGMPLIGRARGRGDVWLATGHQMAGLKTATGTGLLLAQLMAGESPRFDPEPFRADRY